MMQVASLGMRNQPVSLKDLAESPELQEKLGIRVFIRERSFKDKIPLRTVLQDSELTEANGWHHLGPSESAIFAQKLVKNDDGMSCCTYYPGLQHADTYSETVKYAPLLAVVRDVGSTGEQSEAVFEWASDVVGQACHERRNVRVFHCI
jgi:hypothetical protein